MPNLDTDDNVFILLFTNYSERYCTSSFTKYERMNQDLLYSGVRMDNNVQLDVVVVKTLRH